MSKANQSALLSGLVFPGAGYWVVKRPVRGAVSVVVAAACLLFVVASYMQPVGALFERALVGDMPMTIGGILVQVREALASSETPSRKTATYLLVACWLLSIADGYRIGRIQDRNSTGV